MLKDGWVRYADREARDIPKSSNIRCGSLLLSVPMTRSLEARAASENGFVVKKPGYGVVEAISCPLRPML
jgi:hypothetical protein